MAHTMMLDDCSSIPTLVYTIIDKVIAPSIKSKKKLAAIEQLLDTLSTASSVVITERLFHVTDEEYFSYFKIYGIEPYALLDDSDVTDDVDFEDFKFQLNVSLRYFISVAMLSAMSVMISYHLLYAKKVLTKNLRTNFIEITRDTVNYYYDQGSKDLRFPALLVAAQRTKKQILSAALLFADKLSVDDINDTEKLGQLVEAALKGETHHG